MKKYNKLSMIAGMQSTQLENSFEFEDTRSAYNARGWEMYSCKNLELNNVWSISEMSLVDKPFELEFMNSGGWGMSDYAEEDKRDRRKNKISRRSRKSKPISRLAEESTVVKNIYGDEW